MINERHEILQWLLSGDVAIQYQTRRDLLETKESDLAVVRSRISCEGWGKLFLSKRNDTDKTWGNGIYSPKWISTHYTLLDLRNLGIDPSDPRYNESSGLLIDSLWTNKGKVRKYRYQDLCVSAMLMSIACYAKLESGKINEIADYLIERHFADGGWNCSWNRGSQKSSMHTTLSVLEAIFDYRTNGYRYRLEELSDAGNEAIELFLKRRLFKSLGTGEPIDKKMLMISYPCRWHYDILRCLDFFRAANVRSDERMEEALDILIGKKRKNNRWPVQHRHAGLVHFDMEKTGGESRWNTLRALRVLKKYRNDYYQNLSA
jgi:hypothetical protein